MGSLLRAKSPSGRTTQSQRFPGFKVEWSPAGFVTKELQISSIQQLNPIKMLWIQQKTDKEMTNTADEMM